MSIFTELIVFIQVLPAHGSSPSTRLMPVPTTCPKPTPGEETVSTLACFRLFDTLPEFEMSERVVLNHDKVLAFFFSLNSLHFDFTVKVVKQLVLQKSLLLTVVWSYSAVQRFTCSEYDLKTVLPFCFPVLIGSTFLPTSTMTNCTTSCSLPSRRRAALLWSESLMPGGAQQQPEATWFGRDEPSPPLQISPLRRGSSMVASPRDAHTFPGHVAKLREDGQRRPEHVI